MLVLITTAYSVIHLKRNKHYPEVKTLTLFCTVSYIVSIAISLNNPLGSRALYGILLLPLTTFWFYYTYSQNGSNTKFIIVTMSFVVVGLIYSYLKTMNFMHTMFDSEKVLNSSYFVMYMLPFILCIKNKIIRIVSILVISLVVFSSFKRTGTIAVVLAILTYLYINMVLLKRRKLQNTILLLIGIVLILFFITDTGILADNYLIARLQNISEDQGSGRTVVWEITWNMIKEANTTNILFGHGYNQVLANSPNGLSAHNDFLEVLYDYGILVFGIYITIFIQMWKFIRKLIQQESKYAAPMAASFILFFIGSLSSHIVIYTYYFIMFAMFWGMVFGDIHYKAKLKIVQQVAIIEIRRHSIQQN